MRRKDEKGNERAHLRFSFFFFLDELLPLHSCQPRHQRPNSSIIIDGHIRSLSERSIFGREEGGSRGGGRGRDGEGGGGVELELVEGGGRLSLLDGLGLLLLSERWESRGGGLRT